MTKPEVTELLQFAPDGIGECDRCHVDRLELYTLDEDDPAGWQYCRACLLVTTERKAESHVE